MLLLFCIFFLMVKTIQLIHMYIVSNILILQFFYLLGDLVVHLPICCALCQCCEADLLVAHQTHPGQKRKG